MTRKSDTKLSMEEAEAIKARLIHTWAGLVVAVGGCALAIVETEYAYLGIGAALLGAGLLDAKTLVSLLKR